MRWLHPILCLVLGCASAPSKEGDVRYAGDGSTDGGVFDAFTSLDTHVGAADAAPEDTCTDNLQNADEQGVDCGGMCRSCVVIADFCEDVETVSKEQCTALVQLARETRYQSWTESSGWLVDKDPCTWFGVSCEGESVTAIWLSANLLSGALPESIDQLLELREFDLGVNQITALPASVGKLDQLRELRLGGNMLTTLPPSLGNARNLQVLYAHSNALTAVPVELEALVDLRELRLHDNQIQKLGIDLSNFRELTLLTIGTGLISEFPTGLSSLRNLQTLHISNSQLSGPIPSSLGSLTALVSLRLENNALSGPLPSELGSLSKVETLWLNDNALSGAVPANLLNIPGDANLRLQNQSGCLTAANAELKSWLDTVNPAWNNGC